MCTGEFAVGGNPLVKDATNAAMTGVLLSGNLVGVKYQATFPQQATPQYFRLNYGLTNVLRY